MLHTFAAGGTTARARLSEATIEHYRAAIRGEVRTYRYLIELDGAPTGLIAALPVSDHREYVAPIGLDEDAVGADLFIGEAGLIGRGEAYVVTTI